MALDLNEYDESVRQECEGMAPRNLISFCCVACERVLPLYKAYREGSDWRSVDRCLEVGWAFVRGKKVKLPKPLWDSVREGTGFYYYEGYPLLLFATAGGTDLLRALKEPESDYATINAARLARKVIRAAEEVDAVLTLAGSAAAGSAVAEESEWLRRTIAAAKEGPLEPLGIDLESKKGLPGWWDALAGCREPVRKVKLD
ncbi:MAG: hypothetical protein U0230_03380 [Polyangiales bacterium]